MQHTRVTTWTLALLIALAATSAHPQVSCPSVEESSEQVLSDPVVTLAWDSSSRCANAPDADAYEFTVTVRNDVGSAEPVVIEGIRVMRTPRPQGQTGGGTISEIVGLPTDIIAPGESVTFALRGNYRLLATDEGGKANLHVRADGRGTQTARTFVLGLNVQFAAAHVAN